MSSVAAKMKCRSFVDPQLLAVRGLSILDVRNALRGQNRDISAGDLWEGKRRYVIRTLGRFRTPDQVGNVIVAESDTGSPTYLRDVAEIQLGYKKPTGVVKNFGTQCLAINCIRDTGANVLDTMEGLRDVKDRLNEDLLRRHGLELIQAYDETEYIKSSIKLVNQNIFLGGALTIGILLIFLRSWRSTIVIALAIPTSLIGTFLLLNLMGRSLNVISLAGLAFAVGMLVDNAVVVLENCYRHAQMGDNPFTAAVRGAQEVWGAVVASTLTTLAVFLPVLFIAGGSGPTVSRYRAGDQFGSRAVAARFDHRHSHGCGSTLACREQTFPSHGRAPRSHGPFRFARRRIGTPLRGADRGCESVSPAKSVASPGDRHGAGHNLHCGNVVC